jgi:hypothetical protein
LILIIIRPYDQSQKPIWNAFVAASKNGTFLLGRDYMDYHADRFEDASLLFQADNRLLAVLPASRHGEELVSHGGLTYGGLVCNQAMTTQSALECFALLKRYMREHDLKRLVYKRVPAIYHCYPADEDLYALFRHEAVLARRDLSTVIDLRQPMAFNERRRRNIKKAVREGLIVREATDFESYFDILNEILVARHQARPTHSATEMALLAARHPESIRLFAAYAGETMLAGALVYETPHVAHTQYLANSFTGGQVGALDLVIEYLVRERYRDKLYFDFGISTEDQGRHLNEGLVQQKQEFGGRAVVHDFYELTAD